MAINLLGRRRNIASELDLIERESTRRPSPPRINPVAA
jgi:hypothetical protein